MEQRTTQPIRSEELVPLLATSSGQERITARIPLAELAGLVSETRTDLPVLAEVGDMLRANFGGQFEDYARAVPAFLPVRWHKSP